MTFYDPLANSPFALNNTEPPPELLNLPQEISNLQEYQPPPNLKLNLQPQPQNLNPYPQNENGYLPTPVNSAVSGIHNNLLNFKTEYADAENKIQELTPYLQNGNDNQKRMAQNYINSWRDYQNALTNEADMLRETARNLGVDTTGFNKENTLAESQQLMQTNNARAIQGLLNLKSVPEQQRDIYNSARQLGMTKHDSRILSANMDGEIKRNLENQLIEGLQTYGFNSDGSMNQFGAILTSKLAAVNPYVAEPLLKTLPTPQNAYSEMNENQRLLAQLQGQSEQYDRNFRNDLIKLQKVQDFTREENERAAKLEMLKTALKGTGVAQDKMDTEIQNLTRLFGGDQQKAAELYLAQHYGNGLKLLNNDSEILKDEQKLANFTDGCFGAIEYFIKAGNYEQAQTLIDDFKTKLLGDDFKYAESMNGARMQYFLTQLNSYEKAVTNKYTPEELEEMKNGGRGKSLAEVNHDTAANTKAKKIGEQAAQVQHRKSQQEKYSGQNYWDPPPSTNYNKYPVYSPFDYNRR